jgi:hypothetical protein
MSQGGLEKESFGNPNAMFCVPDYPKKSQLWSSLTAFPGIMCGCGICALHRRG